MILLTLAKIFHEKNLFSFATNDTVMMEMPMVLRDQIIFLHRY